MCLPDIAAVCLHHLTSCAFPMVTLDLTSLFAADDNGYDLVAPVECDNKAIDMHLSLLQRRLHTRADPLRAPAAGSPALAQRRLLPRRAGLVECCFGCHEGDVIVIIMNASLCGT